MILTFMADFDKVSPPSGESFQQLQARVLLAIKSQITGPQSAMGLPPVLRAESSMGVSPVDSNLNTGETPVPQPRPHYLVVTHAGVIRAVASAFSGASLRYAFQWAVPYGSLTSFSWNGGRWSLLKLGVDIGSLAQGRVT
jgi:broad specificity phosphatase PhoE